MLYTETIQDAVKGILQREGDTLGVNYLKYMSVAKDIYRELNLHAIRETKRAWIQVDKKTNRITFPDDYLFFSSISVEDECGRLIPLVINGNLKHDIVDISQDKDCHCECGCLSKLCGAIKNYEVITGVETALMPNGDPASFTTMTRKRIGRDGAMVIEKRFPKAIYEGGVWVSTELVTEEEFVCKLEMSSCGCVKDTPENHSKVAQCCGANFMSVDCGSTYCCTSPDQLTYNIEENGTGAIFPSSFMHNKVLVRYFYTQKTKDIRFPFVAKKALMLGIKAEIAEFSDTETEARVNRYIRRYNTEMGRLRSVLNRFNLKGFYDYVLGKKQMI